MCFIDLECQLLCDFHDLIDIFLFYSLLERFRTSLQVYHKTSCVFFILVEFFKHVIFLNPIFENSYPKRAVGWATMPCMILIDNLFKQVHDRVEGMSYTLDPHHIFNWYPN